MKTTTLFGKVFAEAGNEEQAQMLNEVGYALRYRCVCANGEHGHEMQLCYIADKLDTHGAELVTELAEFVAIRKREAERGQ